MSDFKQAQNGPARRFGHSTSVAGRQSGRMSMAQYTAQQMSRNHTREPKSTGTTPASQPLFRPPASLNHLFPNEIQQINETKDTNNLDSTKEPIDLTSDDGDEQKNSDCYPYSFDIRTPKTEERVARRSVPSKEPSPLPTSSPKLQPPTTFPQSSVTDAESEAWLRLQLCQQEEKKKRTRFVDWPPPQRTPELIPAPVKPPPSPPVVQNTRQTNNWTPPDRRATRSFPPVDKNYAKDVERVEAVGKALEKFMKVGEVTARIQTEIMEYEQCKSKVDKKMTLKPTERRRLFDIRRNVERREYSISVEKLVQQQNSEEAPGKKKPKREPIKAKAPQVIKEVTSTPSCPSDLSVPQTRIEPARDDIFQTKAASPQTAMEEEQEQSSSSDESEESEQEEETISKEVDPGPEQLWLYHVYQSDFGYPQAVEGPTLLSSHFNKSTAEDVMRQAIQSCYGSITDRTRVEFRAIIEEDFQEQVVELASGRSTVVRIERELVEEETPRRKRRKKLHRLPTKLYTVIEKVLVLSMDNVLSPNGSFSDSACSVSSSTIREYNDGCSYRQLTECFVLPSDANAEASRLMVSHLTAHLGEEEKFDLDVTGQMDTDARQYLHELEAGGRLYDKKQILPVGKDGREKRVSIQVMEQLVRGPRN